MHMQTVFFFHSIYSLQLLSPSQVYMKEWMRCNELEKELNENENENIPLRLRKECTNVRPHQTCAQLGVGSRKDPGVSIGVVYVESYFVL